MNELFIWRSYSKAQGRLVGRDKASQVPEQENDMSEIIAMPVSQDIMARLAKLEEENFALREKARAAASRKISFKVSEKGGVSVYGLGRFPVSLYRGQWERLLGEKQGILDFIADNAGSLSVKE